MYDLKDKGLGTIDCLMIDKLTGRVVYAVKSYGGLLSLGHSYYPLPWSVLTYDTEVEGFRTSVNEDQLPDAPAYSDDSYRSRKWEARIHEHYDDPSYWDG